MMAFRLGIRLFVLFLLMAKRLIRPVLLHGSHSLQFFPTTEMVPLVNRYAKSLMINPKRNLMSANKIVSFLDRILLFPYKNCSGHHSLINFCIITCIDSSVQLLVVSAILLLWLLTLESPRFPFL